MPLSDVKVKNLDHDRVTIYDGNRFLCEIDRYASTEEKNRIAQLICDLLANHGANDDTTGLYDNE